MASLTSCGGTSNGTQTSVLLYELYNHLDVHPDEQFNAPDTFRASLKMRNAPNDNMRGPPSTSSPSTRPRRSSSARARRSSASREPVVRAAAVERLAAVPREQVRRARPLVVCALCRQCASVSTRSSCARCSAPRPRRPDTRERHAGQRVHDIEAALDNPTRRSGRADRRGRTQRAERGGQAGLLDAVPRLTRRRRRDL
jgi:hypothetical protein